MTHTRILVIHSDESLGQFIDSSVENLFETESNGVRVEEIDQNVIPSDVLEP